mgnify:CR=1 FL=1
MERDTLHIDLIDWIQNYHPELTQSKIVMIREILEELHINEEDEIVIILSGEAVLVEDDAETLLRAGDIAAWAAGEPNGHHLINRSDCDCVFIAIGAGDRGAGGVYADIDMTFGDAGYFRKDGTPYPTERIK